MPEHKDSITLELSPKVAHSILHEMKDLPMKPFTWALYDEIFKAVVDFEYYLMDQMMKEAAGEPHD